MVQKRWEPTNKDESYQKVMREKCRALWVLIKLAEDNDDATNDCIAYSQLNDTNRAKSETQSKNPHT